jgi:hypothetical protein
MLSVLGVAILLAIIAGVIETTNIGDVKIDNRSEVNEYSRLMNTKQYDTVLLKKKQKWAIDVICFSPVRNYLYIGEK